MGSAFARLCEKRGIPHKIITRKNYGEFAGKSCDIFINANGNSKKFLSQKEPLADFDASIRTVCSSLHDFRYDKYVLCSSCDVYPDLSNPSNNSEATDIDITKLSRYGFHKYVAEQFVRYEASKFLIFRFGGFVGPGMTKNPIFDILNGGPLWLHPGSRLQYLHTDVAADRVWRLVENNVTNETVNLCGNGLIGLDEVMARLGLSVPVNEGSLKVVYEINIRKALGYFDIPESRQTVLEFVDEAVRGAGRGLAHSKRHQTL